MADLSDVTSQLPSASSLMSGVSGVSTWLLWAVLFVIFVSIVGVIIFFVMRAMKFKYKIAVFEKIGGRWQQQKKNRAMEIPYGKAGDTVFVTLKGRKYLPRPQIQTGPRTYWYAIREDGEWINVGLEDIDMQMKRARVNFLHPDMRYARTSLQRGFKEEFAKPKFMEKYGHILVPLAAFAMIGLFFWLIADKVIAMPGQVSVLLDKQAVIADKFDNIISKLDNIMSSSGVRPAG